MNFCGFTMSFTAAGIHGLYAVMACFMWFVSLAFSLEYMHHYKHKPMYYAFMLATFGATAGVFLSADLLTTFVFFEIMSFTSYVLVIHDESKGAMRAGDTYLAVAVIGGMVMLMGLFLLYDLTGTLKIAELPAACEPYAHSGRLYAAAICMLVGFGAKAGMFPLHIWLPKAHPVAPAPASALLSGILTKAGIYGAIIICCYMLAGDEHWAAAILAIGGITMFLGAFLAVFSGNLKKTLACSSVSQIGFITVGIGIACLSNNLNEMASKGTVLHMVNHSLIKLLLFSCAGVVYMNLHKLALSDVRGWGKNKPLLALYFAVGALTISGVPGTSGYISKTLLHESIVEMIEEMEHAGESVWALQGLEWVFLISGGLTFAYMSRLFFCLFIRNNRAEEVQKRYNNKIRYMNPLSAFVIALPAVALLCIGIVYWRRMSAAEGQGPEGTEIRSGRHGLPAAAAAGSGSRAGRRFESALQDGRHGGEAPAFADGSHCPGDRRLCGKDRCDPEQPPAAADPAPRRALLAHGLAARQIPRPPLAGDPHGRAGLRQLLELRPADGHPGALHLPDLSG